MIDPAAPGSPEQRASPRRLSFSEDFPPSRSTRRGRYLRTGIISLGLVVLVAIAVGYERGAPGTQELAQPLPPVTAPPPAESTPPGQPIAPLQASAVPTVGNAGSGEWSVAAYTQQSARESGRTIRLRVRVEDGLPIDVEQAAAESAQILLDDRSWQDSEDVRFDFVGTGDFDATINIASPDTTDALCAPALTRGTLSCRNGNLVALNANRWLHGADAYGTDLPNYRRYLVNHEIGHILGYGHEDCPGPGQPAPLMMQQTKGIGECTPNPWPN